MKILHLSDLHSHWPRNLGAYDGHMIITGDALDDGAAFELAWAGNALAPLKGRITLVKGNHDDGLRGLLYSPESAERFDNLSQSLQGHRWLNKKPLVQRISRDGQRAEIISLNSCCQTPEWNDYARGEIGQEQLADLSAILDRSEGVRIIALHHHPFIESRTMGLNDAEDFLRVIHGRADALLFGHWHKKERFDGMAGIPLVLSAPASWMAPHADELVIENRKVSVRQTRLRFVS